MAGDKFVTPLNRNEINLNKFKNHIKKVKTKLMSFIYFQRRRNKLKIVSIFYICQNTKTCQDSMIPNQPLIEMWKVQDIGQLVMGGQWADSHGRTVDR